MKDSKIEWTDHTFNPWWGCQRVSEGCTRCYAEAFSHRLGRNLWGPTAPRRVASPSYWRQPLAWDAKCKREGIRQRVFCASMADVFEDRRDLDAPRAWLWELIERTPSLDWLLLTKRPENMTRLAPKRWHVWWPRNVWAGCTVEDSQRAEERIPELAKVPAAVRFLSCEPLLEDVDISQWVEHDGPIHWLIIGGESGAGARPCALSWARNIIEDSRRGAAAVFVKQLGAKPYEYAGDGSEDGCQWSPERAVRLKCKKGGDWSEWPDDFLKRRQFPRVSP